MNFVKNNYYRLIGSGVDFSVSYDVFPKIFDTHYVESINAAKHIKDCLVGKINIMYSGGLDSEFALSSFLQAGINVHPVFVKLCPNYNYVDYAAAVEFCKNKKIDLTVIDIDFDKFVKSGQIFDIAQEMQCSIYHRSALAYGITQLDGNVVCGDCEPYLKKYNNDWYLEIDEHEFSMGNWFIKNGILGTPYFGCYSAEKVISYLNLPRIQDLINNKIMGKLSSFSSKSIIYNSNSTYNLKDRPKLTGYEELEKLEIFQDPVFSKFDDLKKRYGGTKKFEIKKFLQDCMNHEIT